RRGLWLVGIAGAVVLTFWIVQRLRVTTEQQDNLAKALQLVEKVDKKDPKVGPAWTAVIFRGAGEFYVLKKKAKEAQAYFTKARAVVRAGQGIPAVDRDLFLIRLGPSQT